MENYVLVMLCVYAFGNIYAIPNQKTPGMCFLSVIFSIAGVLAVIFQSMSL